MAKNSKPGKGKESTGGHAKPVACVQARKTPGVDPVKGRSVGAGVAGLIQRMTDGGGAAMPAAERGYFEPRLGHGFGDVRIHTGADANVAASAINADAFTVGRDVAFARGTYDPATPAGVELLGHELAHVA